MNQHPLLSLSLITLSFLLATSASAAEFEYSIANKKSQTDGAPPTLVLTAKSFVEGGKVVLTSKTGKNTTVKLGKLGPGKKKKIPLKVKEGVHQYSAMIEAKDVEGGVVKIPLEFQVIRVAAIKMKIDRERVDTGSGLIPFKSNRPVDRVDAVFFDEDGKKLGEHSQSFGGKYGDLTFKWGAGSARLGGIEMKVYDVDGFWTGVMLEPWWIEIEHKDIIFDFGKDSWQPSEEPKLVDSLKEIKKQMNRNAKHRPDMRLYVAGYTDTVGSAGENQKLSERRARAISGWFKKNGITMSVYYQGFGEDALAVKTKDEVAEAKNRRAVYMLGNGPPPKSETMPKARWKRAN